MIINEYADAVVGLQYGDEGKGKVTASLIEQMPSYQLTARYNGGPNAGHSIHKKNGAHYALHQIPSSVPYQSLGWIGPGTVLDVEKLKKEIEEFKTVEGFDPTDYLYISPKVSLIEDKHKEIDNAHHYKTQGSTRSGIAPAYAQFYNRTASQAGTIEYFKEKSLIKDFSNLETLLLEGAQGFYLDPHSGNYPYTTSSFSHPAYAACNFGFSPKSIRHIIGVAKVYETRSGEDPTFYNNFINGFQSTKPDYSPHDLENFKIIQKAGKEYGVTTGRKRAVNYLSLPKLVNAIRSTGTTVLVINKWDILTELKIFKLISYYGEIIPFTDASKMFKFIQLHVKISCPSIEHIVYSASPQSDFNWCKVLKI
jgi:adenylosuccinate synthase